MHKCAYSRCKVLIMFLQNLGGTPESGRVHLDGIGVLLQMKGGLVALTSMDGITRRLIYW